MSDRPLVYTEFAPGNVARDIALTYWGFQVHALPDEGFVHRVWPDGCITLTLVCVGGRAVGAHVLGVRQRAFDVPLFAGARYWGVRFRPEAGAVWLGVSPVQLRERSSPAATLLGDEVLTVANDVARLDDEERVRARLDAWIVSRGVASHAIDPVVRTAVAAIVATDGQRPMIDIARDVGVSARVLQRRFAASVGLSPKAFAVLRRGRGAIKRVLSKDADVGGWSAVALSSGYADQSHFTREVARLTRFAPTALQARLATIEHERLID